MKHELPKRTGQIIPQILRVFASVVIGLALINLATNYHKKRHLYIVIGILSWLIFVGFAISSITLISDVKSASTQETFSAGDCRGTMVSIHEDDLSNSCPFGLKYLKEGTKCRKKDLV